MKPTNTTTEAKADPMSTLFRTGFPGGIERQEAAGQSELVKSESLPSECSGKAALEAAGVVFGAPYPDDKLFCPVTLPKGWKKQATDHAMHSNLLDDKGRIRASIFYKAAYYDRRADMYPKRRYSVDPYRDGSDDDRYLCVVKDGDTVIHTVGETKRDDYKSRDVIQKEATNWLTANFPKWEDAAAYWD